MAIAYGGSLTSGTNESNLSTYSTASVTPTASTLVLAFFHVRNNTANQATVTGSGCNLAWTTVMPTGDVQNILLWGTGASPSAGAISINNLANATGALWSVFYLTGIDTTTPIVQNVRGTGTSTSPATTLSTFSSTRNNATIGLLHISASGTAITPGSGFTEIHETRLGTTSHYIETEYQLAEDTTVNATSSVSGAWEMWGFEINEALSTTAKNRRSAFINNRIGSRSVR